MKTPTGYEAVGGGLCLSFVVHGEDADRVLGHGGQLGEQPGGHTADIHLHKHLQSAGARPAAAAASETTSHLGGLHAVGLHVHDAVAVDLPGGGVPGELGGAVVHVGETQVDGRAERH